VAHDRQSLQVRGDAYFFFCPFFIFEGVTPYFQAKKEKTLNIFWISRRGPHGRDGGGSESVGERGVVCDPGTRGKDEEVGPTLQGGEVGPRPPPGGAYFFLSLVFVLEFEDLLVGLVKRRSLFRR
jgi:hypothetical protein